VNVKDWMVMGAMVAGLIVVAWFVIDGRFY